MARRNRSNTPSTTTQGQRDFSTQSLASLLTLKPKPIVLMPVPVSTIQNLGEVEDRRTYQPDRSTRPPRSTRPGASRVVADPKSATTLRFADPAFVGLCERRSRRRQVLFALKRTRKGAGSSKRYNFWSSISCSRR